MAYKYPADEFTLNSASEYVIGGDAGQGGAFMLIQLVSSSFSGSVTVKARASGSAAAEVPIPYKRRNLGGTVSDDTVVSAAITDSALIEVNCLGLDVVLDCTTYTSGSLAVYVRPRAG
jgi:hypothetical protein